MPLSTVASEIGRSIKIQKGAAEKKPLLRDGKLTVTIGDTCISPLTAFAALLGNKLIIGTPGTSLVFVTG